MFLKKMDFPTFLISHFDDNMTQKSNFFGGEVQKYILQKFPFFVYDLTLLCLLQFLCFNLSLL
jgi:hypothetical protein